MPGSKGGEPGAKGSPSSLVKLGACSLVGGGGVLHHDTQRKSGRNSSTAGILETTIEETPETALPSTPRVEVPIFRYQVETRH